MCSWEREESRENPRGSRASERSSVQGSITAAKDATSGESEVVRPNIFLFKTAVALSQKFFMTKGWPSLSDCCVKHTLPSVINASFSEATPAQAEEHQLRQHIAHKCSSTGQKSKSFLADTKSLPHKAAGTKAPLGLSASAIQERGGGGLFSTSHIGAQSLLPHRAMSRRSHGAEPRAAAPHTSSALRPDRCRRPPRAHTHSAHTAGAGPGSAPPAASRALHYQEDRGRKINK